MRYEKVIDDQKKWVICKNILIYFEAESIQWGFFDF